MNTKGNLELRLHEKTLYASTNHDGYAVYKAIPRLVEFLDLIRNPTKEQFETWFRRTSKEVFPYNYHEGIIGGIPDEVIFDIPRKLVLHTDYGEADDLGAVSKRLASKLENACILLRQKHNYEILKFTKPLVREVSR